ncbi:MAG TPA: aminotransferase class V-fold PLP-dependent enzyme [Candidatus Limnocylindria bacterium]|nr:aminotransferase class V-fold PLP-dependent enzyme [Candidatus Limnocylindria bacterium]
MTSGRHFLQIPGPTNVPERVLRAMDRPVPDHRGPEMPSLVAEIRTGLRAIFRSERGEPVLFPGSGTGAWEASIVNTLSPGERVLSFENGHFAHLYGDAARKLAMQVDEVKLRWGDAVTESDIQANLKPEHRAVLIVHNETSTGVTTDVAAVRRAIDRTGLEPLLLVDVVSALGSIDFRMDEWRVDVALTGTQKGLMLPPGGAILCVGPRALEAAEKNRTPRYFYDWRPVIRDMQQGFFPYTPPTLLLFGLREALRMLLEEGLDNVLARHARLAEATREAVRAWGLKMLAGDPARASNSLTAVVVDAIDPGAVVKVAAERLNLALGVGLGQLRGRVFRIGHLGSLNELEVLATLAGTELALLYSGQTIELGVGVAAAQRFFAGIPAAAPPQSAKPRVATPERVG